MMTGFEKSERKQRRTKTSMSGSLQTALVDSDTVSIRARPLPPLSILTPVFPDLLNLSVFIVDPKYRVLGRYWLVR